MKASNPLQDKIFLQQASAAQIQELLIEYLIKQGEQGSSDSSSSFWLGRTYNYLHALLSCLVSLRDKNIIIIDEALLQKHFSLEELISMYTCSYIDKAARDNLHSYLLCVPGLSLNSKTISETAENQHGFLSRVTQMVTRRISH